MVRPSTWNPDKLRAAAVELSSKYHKANIITVVGDRGEPVRLDPWPLTDEKWREVILDWRKSDKDWNWDPGTTARVRVYFANDVGSLFTVDIDIMRDGKKVSHRQRSGGREAYGYYQAMKKLGIYIPG